MINYNSLSFPIPPNIYKIDVGDTGRLVGVLSEDTGSRLVL